MAKQLALPEAARTLVQQCERAILSTLDPSDATPYGSLVEVAPLENGDIVLLLSQLAEHRRYLDTNPRASITIAPHIHEDNALARPRVTLLGAARRLDDSASTRECYLQRHPDAEFYLSLGDFAFYRLEVERARYIAQ